MATWSRAIPIVALMLVAWLVACTTAPPTAIPTATPISPVLPTPTPPTPTATPTPRQPPPAPTPLPTSIPWEKDIWFGTIAKGAYASGGSENPSIFVPSNATEALRFTPWLGELLTDLIEQLDFSKWWRIAVFAGIGGWGCSEAITVRHIERASDEVQVTVQLTLPPEGTPVCAALTNPYHIVAVKRNQLAVPPRTTWAVYDMEGRRLAHTEAPLPTIPFQTVAQDYSVLEILETPTLAVAGSKEEAYAIYNWRNFGEIKVPINQVDFNNTLVIGVTPGGQPYSEDRIHILAVYQEEGIVRVTVLLTTHERGIYTFKEPGGTFYKPYHIILVPREAFHLATGTKWQAFTVKGELLAEAVYPK